MTSKKQQNHLFSMVELIVAVLIFTMLMSVLLAFSSQVTINWEKMQKEKKTFAERMNIDRVVDNIFSNTIPFIWRDDEKKPLPIFEGDASSCSLVYQHRVNKLNAGGLRFAVIVLEEDELVVYYRQRPMLLLDELSEDDQRTVLATKVSAVTFSYADWDPDQELFWCDVWLADAEEEGTPRLEIPLAIMMTVVWEDDSIESWVRRTAGNSWRERLGNWKPQKVMDR